MFYFVLFDEFAVIVVGSFFVGYFYEDKTYFKYLYGDDLVVYDGMAFVTFFHGFSSGKASFMTVFPHLISASVCSRYFMMVASKICITFLPWFGC